MAFLSAADIPLLNGYRGLLDGVPEAKSLMSGSWNNSASNCGTACFFPSQSRNLEELFAGYHLFVPKWRMACPRRVLLIGLHGFDAVLAQHFAEERLLPHFPPLQHQPASL